MCLASVGALNLEAVPPLQRWPESEGWFAHAVNLIDDPDHADCAPHPFAFMRDMLARQSAIAAMAQPVVVTMPPAEDTSAGEIEALERLYTLEG